MLAGKVIYFVVDVNCQILFSVDLRYGFVHKLDSVPDQNQRSETVPSIMQLTTLVPTRHRPQQFEPLAWSDDWTALLLHRDIGVTQKTAWFRLHPFGRHGQVERILCQPSEADEAY